MARSVPIAKVDKTQPDIVAALRAAGMSVQHLSAVGQGVPDLLVGWKGWNFLVECKTERKDGGRGRGLSSAEAQWHEAWAGRIIIAASAEEAVGAIVRSVRAIDILREVATGGGL